MRKIIPILILLFTFILPAKAKYHTKWIDVTPFGSIKYVLLDADSVNIHNNSIYYAVKRIYKENARDIGEYLVIQCKGNKAGIVKYDYFTYYLDIMMGYSDKPHPAYTAEEAKEFKEIDKSSFLYKANKKAKEIVEIKKTKPESMYLENGLYGIKKKD